jgi:hypothetical protein
VGMTNLKALALTALCVAWPLTLPCGPRGRACAEPARPERYDHFVHGVCITPSESVLTVPLTKVFTAHSEASVCRFWASICSQACRLSWVAV